MKKTIEFAAAKAYSAPCCKMVKMMARQSVCQGSPVFGNSSSDSFTDDNEDSYFGN